MASINSQPFIENLKKKLGKSKLEPKAKKRICFFLFKATWHNSKSILTFLEKSYDNLIS